MLNIKFGEMKKIGLFVVTLALVAICSSCQSNKNCPAYSDNSVEVEQNV